MKACKALILFGLHCTVITGALGQLFHFENAIRHNETCGVSHPNVWSVEGSVTLTPGLAFFQPKVVIQATQELCSVDLTDCSTEHSSTSDQACSCASQTGNNYKLRVGSKTSTSQSGMTLQAVIPGHGVLQNIFGATDIGTLPTTESPSPIATSFSMNDEEARELLDEQTLTVCPFHRFALEICVHNGSSDATLKIDLDLRTTSVTGGRCIALSHSFTTEPLEHSFSTMAYEDMTLPITEDRMRTLTFEYKEPEGCSKLYYIHFKGGQHCGPATTPGWGSSDSANETTEATATSAPQQIEGVCPDTPRTVRTLPNVNGDVLMDEVTFNKSWVIFQRRVSGAVDFYRPWSDYVEGFGDITDSFWLGLKQIHKMCNVKKKCELLVHMTYPDQPFGVKQRSDGCYYERYDNFWLAGAKKYKLKVSGSSGSAGDSLVYFYAKTQHSNRPFSTYDKDHDNWKGQSCAKTYHGAWWYNDCLASNLNGKWGIKGSRGLGWTSVTGTDSATFTEMKLRPHDV